MGKSPSAAADGDSFLPEKARLLRQKELRFASRPVCPQKRAIRHSAAREVFFPRCTPPGKTKLHFICGCGRKLCEALLK